VAKKRQKGTATRKGTSKPPKAARRPAGKSARKSTAKVKATAAPKRAVATARPAPQLASPTLGEQTEHLRDEIQRSKLTHPNPWAYAAKVRAWGERAQALVEQIAANGDTPAARRTLEALDGEVQGDRDFREARRLF